MSSSSTDILYSRYLEALQGIEPSSLTPHLLNSHEVETIQVGTREELARILASRGSGALINCLQAIKQFKKNISTAAIIEGRARVCISAHSSPSSSLIVSSGGPPVMGEGEEEGVKASCGGGGGQKASYQDEMGGVGQAVPSVHPIAVKKHQVTDVPDPPTTIEATPTAIPRATPPPEQMEAYVVLFYTYLVQCAHSFHSSLLLSGNFPWLQWDVRRDHIKNFFPQHMIRGVQPTPDNPVPLRLSVILQAFQQFFKKFESLSRENKSLLSRVELVQDLAKRNSALEGELRAKELRMRSPVSPLPLPHSAQGDQLRQALARSEERNKQLVAVTQQWALECSEKEKQAVDLQEQVKELQHSKEQYKRRLAKARHQAGSGNEGANEMRFEEMRVELDLRRTLYDKVLSERDSALEQVETLLQEKLQLQQQLEEEKDLTHDLKDRLDNLQLQAKVKEPSVREMAFLLEGKREVEKDVEELQSENERLRKALQGLQDEVLAYKTHMADAAMIARQHLYESQFPSHNLTSRSPPTITPPTITPPTPSQMPSDQPRPKPRPRVPRPKQALVPGIASHQEGSRNGTARHRNEDQNLSRSWSGSEIKAARVECLGNQPHSWNGTEQHPAQNGTVENDAHDYTLEVRYPNQSGILVQPLQDDDLAVIQLLDEGKTVPKFFDNTPLLPASVSSGGGVEGEETTHTVASFPDRPSVLSPPLSYSSNERKCPVCEDIFLMLSDSEFRSHVASCFK